MGRVVRVTAEVVDVAFDAAPLPALSDTIAADGCTAEVVAHLGDRRIRAAASTPTGAVRVGAVATVGGPLRVPAGSAVLGRVLGPTGEPRDGGAPVAGGTRPLRGPPPAFVDLATRPTILDTGAKGVDLLAPWPKGGRIGVQTDGPSVEGCLGPMLRAAVGRGRPVVVAGIGAGAALARTLWAAAGPDGASLWIAEAHEPPGARWAVAHAATACAEGLRDEGSDVVLALCDLAELDRAASELAHALDHTIDGHTIGLGPLHERVGATRRGSITALHLRGTPVVEPLPGTPDLLDAWLGWSEALADLGGWPPLDPATSTSRGLDPEVVGAEHARTAREVRERLTGASADPRSRKLLRFAAQPPEITVPVDAAVRGFRALLDGHGDALPEAAFLGVGPFEDALARG